LLTQPLSPASDDRCAIALSPPVRATAKRSL
jgi:hypothetical protein